MMTTRSLTVMVVAANEPKEIDAMSFATRRERASKPMRLSFPSTPYVVARRALNLGSAVYESPRVWDETTHEVVETSLITNEMLVELLEGLDQLEDLDAVAESLVREAGTDEDLARVARTLAEEAMEPAAGPAEEAAAFLRVFHALAIAALEDEHGIAWEERTPGPCECAVWDGTTFGDKLTFPRRQFVTLHRDEAGCGRLRCVRCLTSFSFVATETYVEVRREAPRDAIELGPDEIDRVIAGIRDGAQVMLGGSRCHTTYLGRNGELVGETFDEGTTTEFPCTEDELRRAILQNPTEFLEILRRPLRDVLRNSLVGQPTVSPHQAIRDLLLWGECLSRRSLLAAILDWPTELSPTAKTELASLSDGTDVYHFIRAAVGYETSTLGTGRFGLRVFATLEAMLARELPRWRRFRSDFRVMAGDVEGGIADLQSELARLPENDLDRPYVLRAIAKLADAGILAEIAANPDDDAPRLVWADMLVERGDPRGEMIVAMCRIAKLDDHDPERNSLLTRVNQLIGIHGRTWGKKGHIYWRGFLHGVTVRYSTFAEQLDEAFAVSPPIEELRFKSYTNEQIEDPARILDDPRLERIFELDLSSPRFVIQEQVIRFEGAIVRRLAGRFPNLRALTIRDAQLSSDELWQLGPRPKLEELDLGNIPMQGSLRRLLAPRRFDALTELALDHCELVDDDVAAFANLPALTKLDVNDNALTAGSALALARLRLRSLDLSNNAIGDDGASAIAAHFKGDTLTLDGAGIGNTGVAALSDLELASLTLASNAYTAVATHAIGRGRIAKTLRKLVLGPCGEQKLDGREIVRALAGMPQLWLLFLRGCTLDVDAALTLLDTLPQLRTLTLGSCGIDDAGLARIVAHPAFSRIDTLELDHNDLGPDAGEILARCPQLPRTLYLNNNKLGDAGALALAEAPATARVVELLLLGNGISGEGATALVSDSSQIVGSISRLCLHDNEIGPEAAAICNEKLGPRFCYPGSSRN